MVPPPRQSTSPGCHADPPTAAIRVGHPRARLAAAALLAVLACAPPAPTVVSLHPPATALLAAMGLASRQVAPDAGASGPVPPPGAPALVLLPPGAPAPPWMPRGAVSLHVAPRSLDALFALARRIGRELDAERAAESWIDRTRLDLARLSASSYGSPRPHLAAIASLDPLELAGGASFETELLEIAGAESATHGGSELRIPIDRLPEEHRTPDLWLVTAAAAPTTADRARLAAALPEGAPVRVVPLDESWLADPTAVARQLREIVRRVPVASPRGPAAQP